MGNLMMYCTPLEQPPTLTKTSAYMHMEKVKLFRKAMVVYTSITNATFKKTSWILHWISKETRQDTFVLEILIASRLLHIKRIK